MTIRRITVPAILESLEVIGGAIADAADAAGLDELAAFRLRLAADELAANIIMHGYAGAAGSIEVAWSVDEHELAVMLEDAAPPYDPRTARPPSIEELHAQLEERSVGGLGVMLALTSVDQFDYQYLEGKNRNMLKVFLKKEAQK